MYVNIIIIVELFQQFVVDFGKTRTHWYRCLTSRRSIEKIHDETFKLLGKSFDLIQFIKYFLQAVFYNLRTTVAVVCVKSHKEV